MIRRIAASVAPLCALLIGPGSAAAEPRSVQLNAETWSGAGVVFEDHLGRRAMRLDRGEAIIDGLEWRDGTIEFDVAIKDRRGFAGVIFRRSTDGNAESFYLRSHQSGNPDANQYTPIFNGLAGWQIYYGPRFSASTTYRHDAWMTVRLAVRGNDAEVHVDGNPILRFELLGDLATGGVALWTHTAPAWFSNVRVSRDLPTFELPRPLPESAKTSAIFDWQVSEEFAWDSIESVQRLDQSWLDRLRWIAVRAEPNGIANLARMADLKKGNTVLARVRVAAEHAAQFRFGFSDSVRAYVDGELVYSGDNTYGSRDYRFLGTVGLHDTLYTVPEGDCVQFVFAVREAFGGWAIAGAVSEQDPDKVSATDDSRSAKCR